MTVDHTASRRPHPDQTEPGSSLTRRRFLRTGAAAGGGLLLSVKLPLSNGEAEAAKEARFAPNAFIRIDTSGEIVLTMPYVEMGQGTYTSIPPPRALSPLLPGSLLRSTPRTRNPVRRSARICPRSDRGRTHHLRRESRSKPAC
jgi:hypothetical protein